MSLFGGPLPPQTPSQPCRESPYYRSSPPLPSSPPHVRDDDEPAESIERDPDTDDGASDDYTDSESDSGRPRFRGQWWTYRKHIAEERHLTESLAQLRTEDVSLHLYNAHALKRRVQSEKAATGAKPWHSKAKWVDKDTEDAWIPPRMWTAWPLEPSQVPRPHERFTTLPVLDPEDEYTIREAGYEQQKPSREMEDILVGLVLKNAKEKWNNREWEDETEAAVERARSASRKSVSRRSSRAASRAVEEDSQLDTDAEGRSRATTASRGATPTGSRPVITTDDERAHHILQPTIRSVLTKLDDVLTALHHSRQNHFRGPPSAAGNETETAFETDAPQARGRKRRKKNQSVSPGEPSTKRSRGRPPKALFQAPASTPDVTEVEAETSASPRKRKQGRPRKYLRPLPGESYYMMRKRYRQLQAAGQLPGADAVSGNDVPTSRAQTTEPEPDTSRVPSPSVRAVRPAQERGSSVSSEDGNVGMGKGGPARGGDHAVGLRDWSEVLGLAAMLGGFGPAVVDRAARRCADLFGEGMAFQVLEEGAALEGNGERVEYVPEAIPPPEVVESEREDEDGDEDGTPDWDGMSLTCPHVNCSRHTKAYETRWRLREHVKRQHGYRLQAHEGMGGSGRERKGKQRREHDDGEATATEAETDGGEVEGKYGDLVGAVHNDGFLEPLPPRQGWRGKDAVKSEKRARSAGKREEKVASE